MRHQKTGVKLGRTSSHRKALFRNLVTSLFKFDHIQTTDVKAKELRKWADDMITLAKRGDLHARRQALAVITEKDVVYKLFNEAGVRYGDINGGYTRIIKVGRRPGDAAPISLIELVGFEKRVAFEPRKKKSLGYQPSKNKKIKSTESKKLENEIKPVVTASSESNADGTAGDAKSSVS